VLNTVAKVLLINCFKVKILEDKIFLHLTNQHILKY